MNTIIKVTLIASLFLLLISCGGTEEDNGIGGTGKRAFKSPSPSTIDFDIDFISHSKFEKKSKSENHFQLTNSYGLRIKTNINSKLSEIIEIFSALNSKVYESNEGNIYTWKLLLNEKSYSITAALYSDSLMWQLNEESIDGQSILLKGISNLETTLGKWEIIEDNNVILHLDWEVGNNLQSITLENMDPNSSEYNNTYHFYQKNEKAEVILFNKTNLNLVEILWDQISGVGGIRDVSLNDGLLSMWDENHQDIDILENDSFAPIIPDIDTLNIFTEFQDLLKASSKSNIGTNLNTAITQTQLDITSRFSELKNTYELFKPFDTTQSPTQESNQFTWIQTVNVADKTFELKIRADISGEMVKWFYMTNKNDLVNFETVLIGFSKINSKDGEWLITTSTQKIIVNYQMSSTARIIELIELDNITKKELRNIQLKSDLTDVSLEMFISIPTQYSFIGWNKINKTGHFINSLESDEIKSWDLNFENN